jgi:predicted nucleic acid-binding Zn ribbon protein
MKNKKTKVQTVHCVVCGEPLRFDELMMPFNPKICSSCTEKDLEEARKLNAKNKKDEQNN